MSGYPYNIGALIPHPSREVMQNYYAYPEEIQQNIRGVGMQISGGCPNCGGVHAGAAAPGYQIGAQGDPLVQFAMPQNYRKFPVGFDSVADIAGNGTLTVSTQIQVPFRGKRLILNPANAATWFIQQILVGVQLQGPALTQMPGAGFLAEGLTALELDTAQVGNFINIVVLNRSPGGQRFQAGMIGDVVK